MEPREGARSAQPRAAQKAEQEIMKRRPAAVLVIFAATALWAQPDPRALDSKTRVHVEALASDGFDGRLTGSAGERLAGDYIVTQLQKIGARPLPGRSDYRLPFEFTAGTRDGGSSISIASGPSVASGVVSGSSQSSMSRTEVQALSFSDNAEVTAPVVFAGYGLVVPDSQDFGYDSYAGLDVKDKAVLVLRYFPEDADQKTRGILARYSDLRYKAMAARQHGAKAMLVVTGPRSPNAGELIPMTFDTALAGSGIVALSITGADANVMFRNVPDKTLEDAQKALDSGTPHVAGFALPGVDVRVHASVEREKRTGYNAAAYLPATAGGALDKPLVIPGAHYDHPG